MNQDHLRGDLQDNQEKNRAVMSISLANKTNAEMTWINSSVNKSPVKTNGARLEAFTNLTAGKKKSGERKGKSPKRAFSKEVGWQAMQLKTDVELLMLNKN